MRENRTANRWIGLALLPVAGVGAVGFEMPGDRQRLLAIGEDVPA